MTTGNGLRGEERAIHEISKTSVRSQKERIHRKGEKEFNKEEMKEEVTGDEKKEVTSAFNLYPLSPYTIE